MIEELKMLIPLLQGAGAGVFWLALALMAKSIVLVAMPCGVVVFLGAAISRRVGESTAAVREDARLSHLSRAILGRHGLCDTEGWLTDAQLRELDARLGKTCK